MVFRLLSFDYFPPSIDSLFAPLSTAGRSDTETYTRFEPRAAGTTQYLRWARPHLSWGASKVNR